MSYVFSFIYIRGYNRLIDTGAHRTITWSGGRSGAWYYTRTTLKHPQLPNVWPSDSLLLQGTLYTKERILNTRYVQVEHILGLFDGKVVEWNVCMCVCIYKTWTKGQGSKLGVTFVPLQDVGMRDLRVVYRYQTGDSLHRAHLQPSRTGDVKGLHSFRKPA